ncbi:flagellar hook-basal body complex protein [Bacillus sp. T33-2]|uniref:flagellar hook-basal body complex protein n=1 Tax=Bacillus sp. T33-2 TaxID=2054168 RepID=UPI000C76FC71|nr:flagellar hook-basal body complex protein [Bacillus sp. T33-2]PLR97730.1 hypothetical protein CVD19_07210 [Bacillus sp. T33-2]
MKVTDPTTYTGTADSTWTVTYNVDPSATPAVPPTYTLVKSSGGTTTSTTLPFAGGKEIVDGIELDLSGLTLANNDKWTINVKAKNPQDGDEWTVNVNAATQPDETLTFVNGRIPQASSKITMNLPIPSGYNNDPATIADESKKILAGIEFDFTALTQNEGTLTALGNPNGNTEGKLESFNIGAGGEISGVYSNGLIGALGQLAIAKFSNSSGLTKAAGNLFQESINSGTADISIGGDGRGTIASGSLEMSNVDLSEEFTEMITAQRGFQANTRIITTSDEILQELVNLKR